MASSKQALWAAGHDEVVEVNQRGLIDKILARYSGKFTVFRELLQNADDAEARSVEIRFETGAYLSRENGDDLRSDKPELGDLPDLKTAAVHQWTFKNNGIPFRDQDWNRLKIIAEGNPDEEKIGAFGVGFYSLFSITEEPWVSSGGQWMNFYWKDKKNQLYARRGTIPASSSVDDVVDPWTTIQMTLRESGPIPPALDLTRFLVSSITFMTYLSEVSVYFDDKRLVRLSKDCGVSREVPMLGGLKGTSPDGMMNVKSIETTPLHIEAEVIRWAHNVGLEKPFTTSGTDTLKTVTHRSRTSGFFPPQSDGFEMSSTPASMIPKDQTNLLEATSSKICLTIFAANVDVQLDDKLTGELLRSTLKKPPSRLCYELIYTGKEEYDSSVNAEGEAEYATGSVFQRLRADLEGTGSARVFIGHSTGQTTGIGGHMTSRFIPTVERELIDLVDCNVSVWNKELLYVGGFLARSVYEFELDAIKKLWDSAAAVKGPGGLPDEKVQTRLRGRALHALKFFTFYPSTPSPVVSNLMEAAFFGCASAHPFLVISSEGVRNASQVFIPDPEFSGFLQHLPVISDDIVNGAKTMIAALLSREMIKEITFVDVLDELRLRPLSETETIACLKWWIGVSEQGDNDNLLQERSQLLDALVVSINGPPEKTMKLSDARTFLNSRVGESIIPADGPLPSTVLPMSITRSFDPDVLESVFSWSQLSIIYWFRYVTNPRVAGANAEFDITHSARWAERVFLVLAQAWPSLGGSAHRDVIQILSQKSCVPTSTGLKKPDQAYFPNVNLFRDLPIVTLPSEGALEEVLQSLGVRKHVELQIIFDRIIETGAWTTFNFVKYLVSIRSTLTVKEIRRLQEMPAFLVEGAGKEESAAGASPKFRRYRAKDLYEPIDFFRKLGLPIMDWGANNQWRPGSDEAQFIFSLGLKKKAPLTEVANFMIRVMATGNWATFNLVKYLVSVRATLTVSEMGRLSEIPAFPKEGARKEQSADRIGSKTQLHKARDLYEPLEIFRELGLPIINWGADNGWRPQSNEAKFMFSLGLRRGPPLPEILHIAASDNCSVRTRALSFFLDNLSTMYSNFNPQRFRDLAFIPAIVGSVKVLARPFEPYGNPEWAALGFAIVDPTLDSTAARKLKLNKHPPTSELVTLLKRSPPGEEVTARQWFEILAGCVSDFSRAELQELLNIPFVPVKFTGERDIIKRLQPNQCFLGAAKSELYSKLFAFVDFGVQANVFLGACGARQEPSDEDIIHILLTEPRRIYGLDNGRDSYLLELRNLAVNRPRIKLGIISSNGSNMLLGTRHDYVKKDGGKASCEGSQGDWDIQDDFLHPNKVVIVDDINTYRLFGDRIFCAPQEDILEDLYLSLGSPRLSSLVREDYRTSGEVPYSKIGAETRRLVLERLPIFLHEHPQSHTEFSVDWLNKEKNFIVRVFRKLLVTKSLNHGDICDSKSYEASAVAIREGNGPIELWLGENKQVDMYEISTSLCCIIFDSPKANDALLFMTILSTGLKILRQRGYNVDRILPRQKAERQAAEKVGREEAERVSREGSEVEKTKIPITQTNIPLPPTSTVILVLGNTTVQRISRPSHLTSAISAIPERGRPLLRQGRSEAALSQLVSSPFPLEGASMLAKPGSSRDIVLSYPPDSDHIAHNIDMAIKACAPERSNLLRNREEMQIVLDSLDEGYCHVTRKTGDLDLVGSMGDTKIFAVSDLPERESLIQRKHDVLARFIHVLKLLIELYKIPQTSLQIFADKEGQLISLNRGGCLAVNFRSFEVLHDLDVQQGDFSDALIYWYFMLAHGIAHNLVYPHNSEHEFYVSAICKAYLKPLIKLLSDPGQLMK